MSNEGRKTMNELIQDAVMLETPVAPTAKIAGALAKAQGAFKNPLKSHTAEVQMKAGGKYTYTYADLADTMDAIRGPLSDNGLAIVQQPEIHSGDNGVLISVKTVLYHESGESLDCGTVTMFVEDDRPQTIGTGMTYCRRYGLSALGVVSEEDNDAKGTGKDARSETKLEPVKAAVKAVVKLTPPALYETGKAAIERINDMDKAEDWRLWMDKHAERMTETQRTTLDDAFAAHMESVGL